MIKVLLIVLVIAWACYMLFMRRGEGFSIDGEHVEEASMFEQWWYRCTA